MSEYKFENPEENIFDYTGEESNSYLIPELNQMISEYSGGVCSSLTNEGKDCLQSTKYKFTYPNNAEEDINCTNYCFERIMNWFPKLFIKPEYIIINYGNYEKVMDNIFNYTVRADFYSNNVKELVIEHQNFLPTYNPSLKISNKIRNNSFDLIKNYLKDEAKNLDLDVVSYGERITFRNLSEESLRKFSKIFENYLLRFDKIRISINLHPNFSEREVPKTFGEEIKDSIITIPNLFQLPPYHSDITNSSLRDMKNLNLSFIINFEKSNN